MNNKMNPSAPSLMARIGALYYSIVKECDKTFRQHGFPLQIDQVPVLMSLYYSGGASQKATGASLGRDKASINRTISNLLNKDLVKVFPDPADKRQTRVELTSKGKELAEQADVILQRFETELSSTLTEEQRKEFDQSILKINAAVTDR